jgi:ADP-ribose pyrophosphatase YjhB (NUDIX family)
MKKTFYPAGAYRLPTGGINPNEPILDALLRETHEETGLQVSLTRFLAAVGYRIASKGDTPIFYTFAFLLNETGGTLSPIDKKEQVEAFREIELNELPERVAYFEHLRTSHSRDIDGDWRDWGQFRAVIHRLVWEALAK